MLFVLYGPFVILFFCTFFSLAMFRNDVELWTIYLLLPVNHRSHIIKVLELVAIASLKPCFFISEITLKVNRFDVLCLL